MCSDDDPSLRANWVEPSSVRTYRDTLARRHRARGRRAKTERCTAGQRRAVPAAGSPRTLILPLPAAACSVGGPYIGLPHTILLPRLSGRPGSTWHRRGGTHDRARAHGDAVIPLRD